MSRHNRHSCRRQRSQVERLSDRTVSWHRSAHISFRGIGWGRRCPEGSRRKREGELRIASRWHHAGCSNRSGGLTDGGGRIWRRRRRDMRFLRPDRRGDRRGARGRGGHRRTRLTRGRRRQRWRSRGCSGVDGHPRSKGRAVRRRRPATTPRTRTRPRRRGRLATCRASTLTHSTRVKFVRARKESGDASAQIGNRRQTGGARSFEARCPRLLGDFCFH